MNTEQNYQRLKTQLLVGIAGLGGIFLLGTVWYAMVEGWSWTDAAYMTMITLSTVGFSEIEPLGQESRLFTIALIFLGVLNIGYIVNRFTEAVIQGYFQDRLRQRQRQRLIETLHDHYILCGYGRTGHQIALEFAAEQIPFVIVDLQPEAIAEAQADGHMAMQGDATLDDCLITAGIERALCLVAALQSDAENLYTVLSAKTLNPNLRAIARANTEEAVKKLRRAGADAVVSPYVTGGRRLAAAALRPRVMDFVDGIITGTNRSFYLDEFLLDPNQCPCVGKTLSETNLRGQTGALVLAIRRADGTLLGGPMGDTYLHANDLLICMGTSEQLRQLSRLLAVSRPYWLK
ncbi:potassium channel protein [Spirulina major CS-329]|jgi:voltage-gated potassium channel|uniref:potassium channel family protein n=1 Tax=Spirulina TaxID=1154 RepID=UPI00232E1064|nr:MULTISPECIES: potassium channel protein [Spirulina]MDB9495519.1 potassium channel protein [Spirulina subsalsa CS-330]MDB9505248.1 potassium channel protein [Spirulina major CS-329]